MIYQSHGGAGFRARAAWMLYDWAAQPFFTVVLTFIFGPYFQSVLVGDVTRGQALWGYGQGIAGIAIAVTGPLLGAIADVRGPRKPWVALSVVMMVLGLSVTWAAVPGLEGRITLVLAGIILASLGAEYGVIFTNAMLPGLAKPGQLGRLSGQGWAMGYLGGLFMLLLVLFLLALPEIPAFGLDKLSHEPERIVGPLAALWLVVFSLPLFVFVPDQPKSGARLGAATRSGVMQLWNTLRRLGRHRNVAIYLLARMAYYDGVTAVYVFGGLYAAGTFDWQLTELGIFGIILIIGGAIGVYFGGFVDDIIGSKRSIALSIIAIAVAVIGILSISRDSVLFVFSVAPAVEGDGLLASAAERVMIGFGLLVGLFLGPVQASSRSLMARIAPPKQMTEFFGLYALSGRATAWVAPFFIAIVTQASDSRRIGMMVIPVLLIIGLALLRMVEETPGENS